jgi:hypothetical protein
MPYITQGQRTELDRINEPQSTGELNYLITMLCAQFLERKGLNYITINDIIGALESAKLEFYRRVAVPYENQRV